MNTEKVIPVKPHGLNVTQASDISNAEVSLKADAVVVGSGAGGAIAAYKLAKAGKSVIVLEAGPYVPSEKFTEMLAVSMGTMYADHGGQANDTGDITVLQGACVGGSTVVNAALCFRTPDYFLDLWEKDFGRGNLNGGTLDPHFDEVEKNLDIAPNGPVDTSSGAELIKKGMAKLDVPAGNAHRNVRDCGLTGMCFAGCKTDRKRSMLVTYLPWASALGAKIYADTKVTKVLDTDGTASGVEGVITDPATGEKKADIRVDAPIVVMAAGPIQTPLILQASDLANSSGQVGKNFACHPTLSISAEFDQSVNDFNGATHSLFMDRNTLPDDGGYLLLNAVQDPVESSFQAEPGVGEDYVTYMTRYRNTIRLITLIHDENVGEVSWVDGHKSIKYAVDDTDFERMKEGLKINARILFASGAKMLWIPTSQKLTIDSEADIDRVIDSLQNEPARYRYTSFHPQGTCRMGADPKTTVVNPLGETHDVKKLYIADASLLPTSIGYNPSETVYALSSYISDEIIKANA